MMHLQGHCQTQGYEHRTHYALRRDKHLAKPHLVFYPKTAFYHVDGVEARHDYCGDDAAACGLGGRDK